MAKEKYDIFISYRRQGGAQYARILQLVLQQHGYKVFLDYDELTDGKFGEHIQKAIKEAPVFLLVLSKGALERCLNEDDWVRREILLAIETGCKLVPVNPDNGFDGFPEGLPAKMVDEISAHQFSEISFGQTLGVTINFMIEKRIVPCIGKRENSGNVDTDGEEVRRKIEEMDKRQKRHNKIVKMMVACACLTLIAIVSGWFFLHNKREKQETERQNLMMQIEERYANFGLNFEHNDTITVEQLNAIDEILGDMVPVTADSSLWMGMYEVTNGEWGRILKEDYDAQNADLPKTDVGYGEIFMHFIDALNSLTQIGVIDLPTQEEWQFAAAGGAEKDSLTTTHYAGSDDVDEVAWYIGNSGGKSHNSRDGEKLSNICNLFNMSGNVSEMCYAVDGMKRVACGGSYDSPVNKVTITSAMPLTDNQKAATIGFRLVLRKE